MGTCARIQGWIDMCWLRPYGNTVPGGKESAEHACMEEDYKLLPLPLKDLVTQLVGRRTRDQEVWGSIPDTGHE